MTHLDDAELVRLLDGAAEDVAPAWAEHLAACTACSARRDAVAHRGARLARLLAATDPAPRALILRTTPAQGRVFAWSRPRLAAWPPRRLAAAAALVVLMAGGVVPPVRAWVAERAVALWHALTGHERPAAAPASVPAPEPGAGSVSFPLAEPVFTIQVTSHQAEGLLTVDAGTRPEAFAAIARGEGPAELVVMPDGLRIVTTSGSTRSYHVRVPPSVTRVVIEVGGAAARVIPAPPSGLPMVVNLQRPR